MWINNVFQRIGTLFSWLFLIPPASSIGDVWHMVREGGEMKQCPDNRAIEKIIPVGIQVEQLKKLFNTGGIINYVRFYFRGVMKEYCIFVVKGRQGILCICYDEGVPVSIDSRDYICLDPAPDNPFLKRILEEIRSCCGIA